MIRFDSKTARKLVHFCTSIVVHFYATLDKLGALFDVKFVTQLKNSEISGLIGEAMQG